MLILLEISVYGLSLSARKHIRFVTPVWCDTLKRSNVSDRWTAPAGVEHKDVTDLSDGQIERRHIYHSKRASVPCILRMSHVAVRLPTKPSPVLYRSKLSICQTCSSLWNTRCQSVAICHTWALLVPISYTIIGLVYRRRHDRRMSLYNADVDFLPFILILHTTSENCSADRQMAPASTSRLGRRVVVKFLSKHDPRKQKLSPLLTIAAILFR